MPKGVFKHKLLSKKTKEKISNGLMGNKNSLGYKHSKATNLKLSIALTGRKLSEEHKRKLKGENCHLWKGGITPLRQKIYHSSQYQQWRQRIFIRDDFTCQECGDNQGGNLEAHHCKKSFSELLQEVLRNLPLLPLYDAVMFYTPFWDISNGITLCEKCHEKTDNFGKGKRRIRNA